MSTENEPRDELRDEFCRPYYPGHHPACASYESGTVSEGSLTPGGNVIGPKAWKLIVALSEYDDWFGAVLEVIDEAAAERATRQVAAPEPLREALTRALTDHFEYDHRPGTDPAQCARLVLDAAVDSLDRQAVYVAAQGPEQARDSGGLRERIVTALEREPTLDEVRGYGMDGGEGSTFNTLQWRLDLIREALSQGAAHEEPDDSVMQGFRNRHPEASDLFGAAAQGPEQDRDSGGRVGMTGDTAGVGNPDYEDGYRDGFRQARDSGGLWKAHEALTTFEWGRNGVGVCSWCGVIRGTSDATAHDPECPLFVVSAALRAALSQGAAHEEPNDERPTPDWYQRGWDEGYAASQGAAHEERGLDELDGIAEKVAAFRCNPGHRASSGGGDGPCRSCRDMAARLIEEARRAE